MQREYQVDLADLWRGRLSVRKAWVLINGLPPDSATVYALAGLETAAGWRLADLLLGRLVDEVAAHRWQWEGAHRDSKKGRGRPAPTSVLPDLPGGPQDDRPARDVPARPGPARVIPLVSPHRLGTFVNNLDEEV